MNTPTVAFNTPSSTKEAGFTREEAGLDEKDRRGVVTQRRKREDIARQRADLTRETEELRLKREQTLLERQKASFTRLTREQQANRVAREDAAYVDAQAGLTKAAADIQRAEEDLANDPNNTQRARASLAERRAADAAERRGKALAAAYQALPASEQQRFFRQNLIGKSDAERKAFVQATMEAGERQD